MTKLNGQDIIAKLVTKGHTHATATKLYRDMITILTEELSNADTSITLTNLGTFSSQVRDKHPNFLKEGTSDKVYKVKFVASRQLKLLNEKRNPKKRGLL